MKTLIAAIAFASVFAAPIFAQSVNAWGWKGVLAAPASAKSTYAASFNNRRSALSNRRAALSGRTYARDCNVSPASPSYRTNCN
jgi:hypothetical protein